MSRLTDFSSSYLFIFFIQLFRLWRAHTDMDVTCLSLRRTVKDPSGRWKLTPGMSSSGMCGHMGGRISQEADNSLQELPFFPSRTQLEYYHLFLPHNNDVTDAAFFHLLHVAP